jgi:hypothetical protein
MSMQQSLDASATLAPVPTQLCMGYPGQWPHPHWEKPPSPVSSRLATASVFCATFQRRLETATRNPPHPEISGEGATHVRSHGLPKVASRRCATRLLSTSLPLFHLHSNLGCNTPSTCVCHQMHAMAATQPTCGPPGFSEVGPNTGHIASREKSRTAA